MNNNHPSGKPLPPRPQNPLWQLEEENRLRIERLQLRQKEIEKTLEERQRSFPPQHAPNDHSLHSFPSGPQHYYPGNHAHFSQKNPYSHSQPHFPQHPISQSPLPPNHTYHPSHFHDPQSTRNSFPQGAPFPENERQLSKSSPNFPQQSYQSPTFSYPASKSDQPTGHSSHLFENPDRNVKSFEEQVKTNIKSQAAHSSLHSPKPDPALLQKRRDLQIDIPILKVEIETLKKELDQEERALKEEEAFLNLQERLLQIHPEPKHDRESFTSKGSISPPQGPEKRRSQTVSPTSSAQEMPKTEVSKSLPTLSQETGSVKPRSMSASEKSDPFVPPTFPSPPQIDYIQTKPQFQPLPTQPSFAPIPVQTFSPFDLPPMPTQPQSNQQKNSSPFDLPTSQPISAQQKRSSLEPHSTSPPKRGHHKISSPLDFFPIQRTNGDNKKPTHNDEKKSAHNDDKKSTSIRKTALTLPLKFKRNTQQVQREQQNNTQPEQQTNTQPEQQTKVQPEQGAIQLSPIELSAYQSYIDFWKQHHEGKDEIVWRELVTSFSNSFRLSPDALSRYETELIYLNQLLSNSQEKVPYETFLHLGKWFGKFDGVPFLLRLKNVVGNKWFHCFITDHDIKQVFLTEKEGAFLVRFSPSPQSLFQVFAKTKKYGVVTHEILQNSDQKLYLSQFPDAAYSDLATLIKKTKDIPLKKSCGPTEHMIAKEK